jgi:4-hydroxybenzoate polyprenyltransferase
MTSLFREYRSERLPWSMLVAVPLLLAAAARAESSGIASLALDCAIATLLFAQFRILDDLADRSLDARIHPQRALVRATNVRPVVIAGIALALGTLVILYLRQSRKSGFAFEAPSIPDALAVYLAVIVVLALWYSLRANRTLIGEHVLLAKYPAFVWIIARSRAEPVSSSSFSGPLALAMIATYLAACVYEAIHDVRSPARARPALVFGEGLLLAATLAALSRRGLA